MNSDRTMDHLDLTQIIKGENDEKCSVQAFLAYMPGKTKCQQASQPEAEEMLQVFWYPESIPNLIQEKIKSFLLSLPESGYAGIFKLVQYWAPNTVATGGGFTRTFLSVSEQPFGADQICNGVCRYRYFSVLNGDQVNESDPVGGAFLHHLPEFVMNAAEDYWIPLRSFAKSCGFQSSWVIPLVRGDGILLPPVCVGVLEFLTDRITLVEKFQKLTEHVLGFLNSPSDMGNYSSELGLRNFAYSHVDPSGATVDLRNAPPTENGIDHHMVPYDQNSNFAGHEFHTAQSHQTNEAHHGDFSPDGQYHQTSGDGFSPIPHHFYAQHQHGAEASSSNTDTHTLMDDQPLLVAAEENVKNYETSGSMIEELRNLELADDDDISTQDTSQTSVETRTIGKGKPKIPKAMIVAQFGKNMEDAAHALGVHKSTLKRHCRSFGIQRWPSHRRNKVRGLHSMIVKATYGTFKVKFKIVSDIHIGVLHMELGRRFGLEVGSFRIQYEEDGGDFITITCTEDLGDHINSLNSAKQETMHLLLSPAN